MFAHKLIVADQTKETTAREKREEEKEKRKREEKEKKKEEKQLTLFKKSVKFDMAALELVSAE